MADDRPEVRSLWRKPARGERMQEARALRVSRADGVCGDASPGADSPRQLLVASWESVRASSLDEADARCNVVLTGSVRVRPGALLEIGTTALRITMRCAPCARGARLAGVPAGRFGELPRYLAAVVEEGVMAVDDRANHHPDRFECAPERLADRCAWAVRAIPPGAVVPTGELLSTIGADRAYARALPKWLAAARLAGAPVHRVVRAETGPAGPPPSWAPDAAVLLAAEGERPGFRLGRAVWFQDTNLGAVPGRTGALHHVSP